MKKSDFKGLLLQAYKSGNLLTPKHDPDQLHVTWAQPRSIWSANLKVNFEGFVNSDDFMVVEYNNSQHPLTPQYWTLTPNPTSQFNVPGSGVAPYSALPTTGLDTLVLVSGSVAGIHMFAENSQVVQLRVAQGSLTSVGPVVD